MRARWWLVCLVVLIASLLAYVRFSTFFEIDNCLDRGGRWVEDACEEPPKIDSSDGFIQ